MFKAVLQVVMSKQQEDCDDHLPTVHRAYQPKPHRCTGLSPHHTVGVLDGDNYIN